MIREFTKCLTLRTFVALQSGLILLVIGFCLYAEKCGYTTSWRMYFKDLDEAAQRVRLKDGIGNRRLEFPQGRPPFTQSPQANRSNKAGDGHSVVRTKPLTDEERTVAELTETLREALECDNDAKFVMPTKECGHIDYSINSYESPYPCTGAECDESFNRTLEKRVRDVLFSPQYQLSKRQLHAILSLGKDVPKADIIIASSVSSSHYNEMQGVLEAKINIRGDAIVTPQKLPGLSQAWDPNGSSTGGDRTGDLRRPLLWQLFLKTSFKFAALHQLIYLRMMFQNLHTIVLPQLINFRVVLFDLGLTPEERIETEKRCQCQVVTFDFSLFPQHVMRLLCYTWKPLIIRAMFSRARKLVIWQDSSIRWGVSFKVILERAQTYGLQVLTAQNKVTSNTLREMFVYMQEKECLFEWVAEVCNAMLVFRVDSFNRRALLDPWCSCALNPNCMCPQDPAVTQPCLQIWPKRCHRFDQSAMTLLLGKLYYNQRYKIEIPRAHRHVRVGRGSEAPYYFLNGKSGLYLQGWL